jgi:MerR family copper efflux transcriptional regulator
VEPLTELPQATDRLIGASCTLTGDELRERLAEWRRLRDRATSVAIIPGGVRLAFESTEPMTPIADLAAAESECCAFYTFTLLFEGPARGLEIRAEGAEPAVHALIGLEPGPVDSIP